MTDNEIVFWLLEKNNHSVRYFALKLLLGKDDNDSEVAAARKEIMLSGPVVEILTEKTEESKRGKPHSYMKRYSGKYWDLMLLLELGADPKDTRIKQRAEYLLEKAFDRDKHVFINEIGTPLPPCYNGYILWAMLKCGLYDKHEVQDCIVDLLDKMRFNDGVENTENPNDGCIGRHTCIRGALPVLRAFNELSKIDSRPSVKKMTEDGAEFLLVHHLYKKSHNLQKNISPFMLKLTFPNFYYPDLLQILDLLTDMGYWDERMEDAFQALLKKRDGSGKWKLDRPYYERKKDDLFPVKAELEAKNETSKWITLKAMKVLKYYGKTQQ